MIFLSTQRRLFVGLSVLALAGVLPSVSEPVRAQLTEVSESIVEAIRQPDVKLTLSAEKQLVELDAAGEEKITWQALGNKAAVIPGDVLRYTITGNNAGEAAAGSLNVSQPIPVQMTYVLDSAVSASPAMLTYSIDGGATFVPEPMVEVELPDGTVELRPAPAEAYTHINWSFNESLGAAAAVTVSYEVRVK